MFSHSHPWLPLSVGSGTQNVSLAFLPAVLFISLHLKGLPHFPSQCPTGAQHSMACTGFNFLLPPFPIRLISSLSPGSQRAFLPLHVCSSNLPRSATLPFSLCWCCFGGGMGIVGVRDRVHPEYYNTFRNFFHSQARPVGTAKN